MTAIDHIKFDLKNWFNIPDSTDHVTINGKNWYQRDTVPYTGEKVSYSEIWSYNYALNRVPSEEGKIGPGTGTVIGEVAWPNDHFYLFVEIDGGAFFMARASDCTIVKGGVSSPANPLARLIATFRRAVIA